MGYFPIITIVIHKYIMWGQVLRVIIDTSLVACMVGFIFGYTDNRDS
jgi:hypothetical protein